MAQGVQGHLEALHENRTVTDEFIATSRHASINRARDSEQITSLFSGMGCSDDRTGTIRCFHDNDAKAQSADQRFL